MQMVCWYFRIEQINSNGRKLFSYELDSGETGGMIIYFEGLDITEGRLISQKMA